MYFISQSGALVDNHKIFVVYLSHSDDRNEQNANHTADLHRVVLIFERDMEVVQLGDPFIYQPHRFRVL